MSLPEFANSASGATPTPAGAIDVPQACFGIARGPVGPIEYVKTTVGQCVAVSLSLTLKGQEFPFVLMGHSDSGKDGAEQIKVLLGHAAQQTSGEEIEARHAYVVNGHDTPELHQPIIAALEEAGYEVHGAIMRFQTPTVVISLRTGHPPDAIPANGFVSYEPDAASKHAFANYVLSNRTHHPLANEFSAPVMAMAFNLIAGMPFYYKPRTANDNQAVPAPIEPAAAQPAEADKSKPTPLVVKFWAVAILGYGLGVIPKAVNVLHGYDVYAHIGPIGPHIKYHMSSTFGAATISMLMLGLTDEKILPKLRSAFGKAADKGEEIAIGLTMAGLTTLELLQAALPKAHFDWPDMLDYTIGLGAMYAALKYDKAKGQSLFSKSSGPESKIG